MLIFVFVCFPPFKMKSFVLFAIGLLVLACNNAPEKTPAEKILRHSEGGDFRGVNIGDDRESVSQFENGNSVYSMPDELVYRIEGEGAESTWYEISYNFNQQGLYDINMDIYPKNDSGLSELKNEFVEYYITKYGECKYYNGYCQWRAMTSNGHIVSITLTDSISESPRPRLKVNFNESQ